jgi:predicted  nucleic acid-binding Zn-ribbon protein
MHPDLEKLLDLQAKDLALLATEGVKRREELEVVIETQRTQQEKRRARIEQVRTAREVQALMTEVDLARSVLANKESDWVKAADATTQQEAAVAEAEQRLAALEGDQTGERARLAEARAALEETRKGASSARAASAAHVERSLLLRYDRLWGSRSTTVVVALRGDACGACFTAIPRNRRSQIRAGTHIDGCEACGVILYPAEGEG